MSDKKLFGGTPVIQFNQESDRRTFLRYAALVGVGGTLVSRRFGDPVAFAQPTALTAAQAAKGDLDILNYALTLEYLEADFYKRGVDGGLLKGRELELVAPIADHEAQHVQVVTQTINDLGGKPVTKPKLTYPSGLFKDRGKFLATASVFEELGVNAYHGQVPLVQSVDILAAAASIAGVESRHAAILADLTGGNPFPRPFERPRPMQYVLKQAMPFIKS